MYSKELKLKLGLLETATDAEVETKLASPNAAAGRVATPQAENKKAADTAFETKYKTVLGDNLLAAAKDLPNRDALAELLPLGVFGPFAIAAVVLALGATGRLGVGGTVALLVSVLLVGHAVRAFREVRASRRAVDRRDEPAP